MIGDLDYVEYPYELLICNQEAAKRAKSSAAILHCASLSLASGQPSSSLVASLAEWATVVQSPWIGEHFSFIHAEWRSATSDGATGATDAPAELYDIGFSVSPPLNIETVERVACALNGTVSASGWRFLVENAPVYVQVPGSTMTPGEAFRELSRQADVGVLLDLAHLLVSCQSMGLDPRRELRQFPLDRVVEVHLSGVRWDSGVLWDDHASFPDQSEYDLLAEVLAESPIRAITHEYNWSTRLAPDLIRRELDRTRSLVTSHR